MKTTDHAPMIAIAILAARADGIVDARADPPSGRNTQLAEPAEWLAPQLIPSFAFRIKGILGTALLPFRQA
jgi:hypothetical protein